MARHFVEGDDLREPVWLAIRNTLMEHWDPVGISDTPGAKDEYDSYIPKIQALLRVKAPVETIIDWITSERMGGISQKQSTRSVASHLVSLANLLHPVT